MVKVHVPTLTQVPPRRPSWTSTTATFFPYEAARLCGSLQHLRSHLTGDELTEVPEPPEPPPMTT
jgi:hypothetical protein